MTRNSMIRGLLPALLLGAALALPSASPAAPRPGDPYLLDSDPVTGEKLPAAAKVVIFDDNGRELRFASAANLKTFQAAPDKYRKAVDAKMIEAQTPFYPLETCVVSGEKLGGEMGAPVDYLYKNRLIRFCCKNCRADFDKKPDVFLKKIDKAVIERQKAAYPAKACVVSNEPLGSMGDPVELVAGNRLIRLCCNGCVDKFRKDPLTYFGALDGMTVKK